MNAGLLMRSLTAALIYSGICIDNRLGFRLFYYGYCCNADTCAGSACSGNCDRVNIGCVESTNDDAVDGHLVMFSASGNHIAAGAVCCNCQLAKITADTVLAKSIQCSANSYFCPCSVSIRNHNHTCANTCASSADCCRTCSGEDGLLCFCGYLDTAICRNHSS